MRIGLHLPNGQPGANAADILRTARTAERLGFDSVWLFDHLFTPSALTSPYPYSRKGNYALSAADPFYDPLALLGVVAGATERIAIATGVLIAAYRHPIVLGKMISTVENVAPGRIVLGVGTGWMREEFEALDVPFERRGARLDEYLAALRAIWSGEPSAFDGEFYSWPEGGFLPAPTEPVPLLIGGHSEAALRRAAKHGDGWVVVTRPGEDGSGLEAVESRIGAMEKHLEAEDRDPAGFELAFQHALWLMDEPNPKLPLAGPPEVVAGNLKRLGDLGVTHVDLIVFAPGEVIEEQAERFAAEVRPLLD